MTDNVENLLLEHMKRFQASLDRIEHKIDELTVRVSNLAEAAFAIGRHLANQAVTNSARQLAIDNIDCLLDRIERRLELAN